MSSPVARSYPKLPIKSDHLPFIVAFMLTITTIIGTYFSYSLYTSDNTESPIHLLTRIPASSISSPHIIDVKSSTTTLPYFANKGNFFNQKFVKLGWAWTSLVIWFHLFNLASHIQQSQQEAKKQIKEDQSTQEKSSHPNTSSSPRPVPRIIVLYSTASLLWVILTQWFFGSPLIERLLILSGGKCIPSVNQSTRKDYQMSPSTQLDHTYCQRRWGQRLPGLDRFLISTHRPYWTGGIDISGHTFLLSFSILMIISSLLPSLTHFNRLDKLPTMYRNSIYANIGLVILWWWMLLMTSLYFHGPVEKATGLIVGTISWWITEWTVSKVLC